MINKTLLATTLLLLGTSANATQVSKSPQQAPQTAPVIKPHNH